MLLTGEHRRERSAEGQWCGADLPGLQMMTMLLIAMMMRMVMTAMLLIVMMMKYYGKVQICIYKHIAYICIYASYVPITSHEFYPGAPAEGVEFRHLRLGFRAQEEDQP